MIGQLGRREFGSHLNGAVDVCRVGQIDCQRADFDALFVTQGGRDAARLRFTGDKHTVEPGAAPCLTNSVIPTYSHSYVWNGRPISLTGTVAAVPVRQ